MVLGNPPRMSYLWIFVVLFVFATHVNAEETALSRSRRDGGGGHGGGYGGGGGGGGGGNLDFLAPLIFLAPLAGLASLYTAAAINSNAALLTLAVVRPTKKKRRRSFPEKNNQPTY